MADDTHGEVSDGAAVFPEIPVEVDVHPLLLAVLHAVVFLVGSSEEAVHPEAAGEALDYIAGYLQRLTGPELDRVRADLECLAALAKQEEWTKDEILFLQNFLADCGVDNEAKKTKDDKNEHRRRKGR